MIIFYDKQTGEVKGTIDGRVHNEDQLNTWIAQGVTERIIVQWKPIKWYDKEGNVIDPINQKDYIYAADFEPQHEQRELFEELDKKPILVYEYKVDLQTKLLVKKEQS